MAALLSSPEAPGATLGPRLGRYGHLYPEADTALRDRLDALYGSAQPAPAGTVEVIADELGPSLRWATATTTRTTRSQGQ